LAFASLENAHTGAHHEFSSLEALFDFLRVQAGGEFDSKVENPAIGVERQR
jgi:hypothetical protein